MLLGEFGLYWDGYLAASIALSLLAQEVSRAVHMVLVTSRFVMADSLDLFDDKSLWLLF